MILQQDLWFWQTAHFSHDTESLWGVVFFPFIYLSFSAVGEQIVKWDSQGVIFTKATETLPPESPDWRQLGLQGQEVSCLNFLVKNADSVAQNCRLISFSVAEGGRKEKSKQFFFFPNWMLVFSHVKRLFMSRIIFYCLFEILQWKRKYFSWFFFPISSDTWESNFRSSQHFISIFNLEEAGNWNARLSNSSDKNTNILFPWSSHPSSQGSGALCTVTGEDRISTWPVHWKMSVWCPLRVHQTGGPESDPRISLMPENQI